VVLLVLSLALVVTTVVLGSIFTMPPSGPCPAPPNSGPSAPPCPATELSTNNLFVLVTLVIVAMGSLVLGCVLLTLAWIRAGAEA
jgi:hypothetical protein